MEQTGSMSVIHGSCLCGSVKWGYDGPAGEMSHCHCSICRKAHAAPFATYFSVAASDFQVIAGADVIRAYESTPGFTRPFCSKCGSVTPIPLGERVAIPAGCLDDDPGIRPTMHIFTASKAPWHLIGDALPQHAAYPAGGPAEIPQAPRGGDGGALKGSCLCGGVAFEVDAPFVAVHNCHCGRCRKARAAAHTTNGFVPMDRFRFVKGADLIDVYKVPEAKSFSQAFCRVCGSGMPRIREDMGVAILPLGALDDSPSSGADDHIFVGGKAAWEDLPEDGLKRFEDGAR